MPYPLSKKLEGAASTHKLVIETIPYTKTHC